MKTIAEIKACVQSRLPVRVAITNVTEEEMQLVKAALLAELAEFVLIGSEKEIKKYINDFELEKYDLPIYSVENAESAPQKAMDLIHAGLAEIPMKGQVHTGAFVKAILKKENGFFAGGRLSQVTMFDGYDNTLQFLTDCAVNIDYSREVKIQLIKNAVAIAEKFGKRMPNVALLGAVETVSATMQDTIDSAVITQMNRRKQIKNCVIDGPLSLDNAISKKYAEIKGIESPVAGSADILVASSLNEANSLSKAIIHYAQNPACSILAGTRKPVIMTSRTDTLSNKLNTVAAACHLYHSLEVARND